MYFFYLMKELKLSHNFTKNFKISKLTDNSKECIKGSIFFAVQGLTSDINVNKLEALKNGAEIIISENNEFNNKFEIEVTGIKKIMGIASKVFYDEPYNKLKMIAITGTNGKSTIGNILFNYLLFESKNVMFIGTTGIYYNKIKLKSSNTTPTILKIYELLNEAIFEKIEYVVMEVSSHAIKELRTFNLCFDSIIYTNITHDHLDYHINMEDYFYTKARLINQLKNNDRSNIYLNKDMMYYDLLDSMCDKNIITYSLESNSDFRVSNISKDMLTTYFTIKKNRLTTKMIGKFNLYNICACVAWLNQNYFNINRFNLFLQDFTNVIGRMEVLSYKNKKIIIDFAHSPDAIKNVLLSLLEYKKNNIISVIGCGGDRDKTKREKIGKIVSNLSDFVLFTNDNPRYEDEKEIINDILKGVHKKNYKVIYDRKSAINEAIMISDENDIIVILGKGDENYQLINGQKYCFNDRDVVKTILKEED